jgi:hypothetical protein
LPASDKLTQRVTSRVSLAFVPIHLPAQQTSTAGMPIRLVTFDALFTLVRPRQPIYVQYAQVFEPHLGVLEPSAIKREFKSGVSYPNGRLLQELTCDAK